MKRRGLLLASAATAVAAAERPRLLLVNAEYPPFVMPAGDPQGEGIDVDIARAALPGYAIELRLYPWRRTLAMLEHGEADLTTTISLSGDRRRFLRFSRPYRDTVRYGFFTRPDGPVIRRLTDLAGLRLVLPAGFFFPPAIREAGVRVEISNDLPTALALVAAGRVQVLAANRLTAEWAIARHGHAGRLLRQPLLYPSASPTYMAVSRLRHGSNDRLLDALDAGLQRLRRGRGNETLEAIERRYLQP